MNHQLLRAIALFCGLTFLAAQGFAQGGATAAVSGHVTDPSGSVIPGAEVTITNLATGVAYTNVSNSVGAYSLLNLPPASYQITVVRDGFQQTSIPIVQLEVNQSAIPTSSF